MPQAIHISPIDNVVVALHPIAKGTLVEVDGLAVTALEDIPQGHKMAVKPIQNGENVIKYGFLIGHATADAAPGTWMHTHNVHTNLSGEVEYSYNPAPDLAPLPKVEPETFMGFRRKDGRAAIRNEIWIIPTVGCVNDIAKKMVADNQDLVTGSIEGLYTFTHPFGCSQTGHDHAQTRKLLAALVRHPNAAAILVLHLGCENLQHDQFVEELGEYDHDRVKFLTCQDVEDEFAAARDILKELAAYAGQFKRQPIPVSELVVGMKCGGSDGLSGITANPTIGRFSDMMGQRGGSTVLTEVPEMFGAEGFLMDRCINKEVFVKAEHMINGFKDYFISHNEVVYDNPSPGNKAGGITTLEDKSCGCVQKGGTAPIMDVIGYGDPVVTKGLNMLYGPGNDLVSATAMTAAGAHLILFSTGRGTPFSAPAPTLKISTNTPLVEKKGGLNMLYGPGNDLVSATAMTAAGAHLILFSTGRGTPFSAPAPTLKISTNTPLVEKKGGWIDFNTGVIADGKKTIDEAAKDLLDLVIRVASGEQTKAEKHGFREISIFKDGVVL